MSFKPVGACRPHVKHVRLTVRVDPDEAPEFITYLLESSAVTEARALDWNRADPETTTYLYAIDGDVHGFADAARETPGVEAVTLSAVAEPPSYAMITVRDDEVPTYDVVWAALARAGLLVRRPLVYRDGRIHGHMVGDAPALQAVLDEFPDGIDARLDEIGRFPSARANPASKLSERQWEAIEAAVDLGYYDRPRRATHEDVADRLGCAPNTASQHLQDAEAKLVHAVLGDVGVDI